MWNIGKKEIIESSFQFVTSESTELLCKMFATIFSCDNITPFGSPVVPDEYTKNARSSFELITAFFPIFVTSLNDEKCFVLPFGSAFPISTTRFSGNPTISAASRYLQTAHMRG